MSVYGNGPRQSSILIRTKPAGGNVLTGAALSAAAQLSQRVWAVTANASYMAEPSQRWTWDDLCARIGGKCWYTSLLDAWQYNVTTIQAAAAAPGGIPQDLIRCGSSIIDKSCQSTRFPHAPKSPCFVPDWSARVVCWTSMGGHST